MVTIKVSIFWLDKMANAKCNGAGTPGMKSKVVNSPGSPCMANTIFIAVSSVRLLTMFIGITKGGTHIHIHTHIYTHTYTHKYIYTHIYTHKYKHTHTHTYIIHTHIIHTHTYIHTHTNTYKHTRTHTHTHTKREREKKNLLQIARSAQTRV